MTKELQTGLAGRDIAADMVMATCKAIQGFLWKPLGDMWQLPIAGLIFHVVLERCSGRVISPVENGSISASF